MTLKVQLSGLGSRGFFWLRPTETSLDSWHTQTQRWERERESEPLFGLHCQPLCGSPLFCIFLYWKMSYVLMWTIHLFPYFFGFYFSILFLRADWNRGHTFSSNSMSLLCHTNPKIWNEIVNKCKRSMSLLICSLPRLVLNTFHAY